MNIAYCKYTIVYDKHRRQVNYKPSLSKKKYTAAKTTEASLKRKDTCLLRRRLLRIPFSLFSRFSRSSSPTPFPPTQLPQPPIFSHIFASTFSPNVFFPLLQFLSSFPLFTLNFKSSLHSVSVKHLSRGIHLSNDPQKPLVSTWCSL